MKPHSFIGVVRKVVWNSHRSCPQVFREPEGLNCGDLLLGVVQELVS
jgi:hypothetical protein